MDEILQKFKDYLFTHNYGKTYFYNIQKFLTYCQKNDVDIVKLNYENFNTYVKGLKESEFSKGYVDNLLKAVRCFYTFLIESNKIDPKVLDMIRTFKLSPPEIKIREYISEEELEELINKFCGVTKRRRRHLRIRVILYFLFYTGLRKGEMLRLRRSDINLEEGKATLRVPTKNRNERTIFFPRRRGKMKLQELLEKYFTSEPEQRNAFNLSESAFINLIEKVNSLMPQGRNITIHSFRHSFARMLAASDIGIKHAQKLLGHKSIASTYIYFDPDINAVEKTYREKLEDKEEEKNEG